MLNIQNGISQLMIWTNPSYHSKQLFHVCLVNSQNYALRCHGQLNALLPEAVRPRAIVHWAVHGTEGHGFDYSTKQT